MKRYILSALAAFTVIFNLGFVFHDLLMGPWFKEQLAPVAREHYIIPLIALGYVVYTLIVAYLYPIYREHKGGGIGSILVFGLIMGVLYDGLEGGIIEFATLRIPLQAFVVDTLYHVCEGVVATLVVALVLDGRSALAPRAA